jgi:hypothetical protein
MFFLQAVDRTPDVKSLKEKHGRKEGKKERKKRERKKIHLPRRDSM